MNKRHFSTKKGKLVIGKRCEISPDTVFEISDNAAIFIGDNVSIRRGVTFQAFKGSCIRIGNDVNIGEYAFFAAMDGINIGDGCGISNAVDFHDHNHIDREINLLKHNVLDSNASGFEVAPITIESGVIISNKVSVTAGVRIGQNSKIGANAVVTKSIPHNSVAVGIPAKVIRRFHGVYNNIDVRVQLNIAFFGTSIMQHLEAYSSTMYDQLNLPNPGTSVEVEEWVNRGYVYEVYKSIQLLYPHLTVNLHNFGRGGANSKGVLERVLKIASEKPKFDLVFVGCGINDVWRKFQGRESEAVGIDEFEANFKEIISTLLPLTRSLVCISETPFDPLVYNDANDVLRIYNDRMKSYALEAGVQFIDVWDSFIETSSQLRAWKSNDDKRISLWVDGVHLSEFGDYLHSQIVNSSISNLGLIENLLTLERRLRE